MKPNLTVHLISLACMTAAHGVPVLLGGFHGENETAQQSPSISDIVVTLARTGASTDITQGFSQVSTTAGWGTQALDGAPADSNSPANHAIFQAATTVPITLVLTITNNGAADLSLDSIHWIVKKDIANVGPPSGTFTYTSGSLSDTAGTSTTFAIANGIVGLDITLSSFLTDTTLANGESAVFTWAHDTPQNPEGNTSLRMDNFAISGSVVAPPDTTPPTPDPMTWASVPAAAGESSITMTADTATDASGVVEYYFTETSGNPGGTDSGWQASPTYTDTGLDPNTLYRYTVTARDLSLNETDPSTPEASATTDPADMTPPNPSPITFLVAPVPVSSSAISMTATTATDASGVEYYFDETSGNPGGTDSGWQDSPTYIDIGLDPETEYTYTVTARDKSIAQNATLTSTTAATTHPAAGIGTTLVGGYHGANENALQSGTITNVEVTLTSTTGDITQGNSQISSTLWGATDLDVASPGDTLAIVQTQTTTSVTLTLTITNNGTVELPLDSLHFIVKKDIANQGPQDFTVAYTAGDLGIPASTIVGLPNGINGFDVPLDSFLSDTTLAGGETATFTWTSGTPQDLAGNTAVRIDNFAISSPVAGPGGTTYAGWSGGASASDDTNGDGVENAVAYVLGAVDVSAVVTGDLPTQDNTTDPDFYIFNFRRSDEAQADESTTIAVQYGNDLASWTTAVADATDVIITETDDFYGTGVAKVEVKLRRSILAPDGKLFARLLVTVTTP